MRNEILRYAQNDRLFVLQKFFLYIIGKYKSFFTEVIILNTIKKVLNHIFIDGLGGMAMGLFATLIVGTILSQIGTLFVGGQIGALLFTPDGDVSTTL